MRIVNAAIEFVILPCYDRVLIEGKRHSDCFQKAYQMGIKYDSATQGFITDTGEFVDRRKAKEIAVEANQLIVPIEKTYPELFSEDLW